MNIWLCDNGLILTGTKSQAIVIRSPSFCVSITITCIDICSQFVATSAVVRDLGFAIDADLSMAAQVPNACQSAYYHLYRISRICDTLTIDTTKCLVHVLVTSRIDYGNAMLYRITDRLLHRLELVQQSDARVVLQIRWDDWHSMTAALKQLHWLPVKWRVEYCSFLYSAPFTTERRRTWPRCSCLMCCAVPFVLPTALLTVPHHNLERYGRRSFSHAGPTLERATRRTAADRGHEHFQSLS